MRCLTDNDVSEWLRCYEIPEDPYYLEETPAYYLQFHAPTRHRELDALARHYFERIIPGSIALVHMTDWSLYTPSEMIAIAGIRLSHGESRVLIDAPGHFIEPVESEVGISLFALSASFAWTAYIYAPLGRTTLFNWEGELFDFWTDSQQALSEMRGILAIFGLAEIGPAEADAPSR